MFKTKIKEVGRIITYTTIRGETKEKLFDNIYQYFNKSNQYCWQVERKFEDENLKEEYYKWVSEQGEVLWWKHATGRDFD